MGEQINNSNNNDKAVLHHVPLVHTCRHVVNNNCQLNNSKPIWKSTCSNSPTLSLHCHTNKHSDFPQLWNSLLKKFSLVLIIHQEPLDRMADIPPWRKKKKTILRERREEMWRWNYSVIIIEVMTTHSSIITGLYYISFITGINKIFKQDSVSRGCKN